ncbi:MAG: hypothetical protein FJW30_13465 [Acidobacteria bacterium]|nr:hypothetical protein [Acidobacteriota bacterium]
MGEPREAPGRAVAWLLPDLAMALGLFTLLYALVFYQAPEQFFRDSDSGWHIRAGERMIERGAVPRVDEFSFSKPGNEWFAWEWAADVAMGAAHRTMGLRGVVLLYWLAIGFASWLWVRLAFRNGGNFWLVCLFASPMLTAAQLHWLARPHVLGWVFLLLALDGMGRRGAWYWMLLSVLWANAHGSFFLLPVLLLIHGMPRYALAASVASLVNPYGWQLHVHLVHYLRDHELLSRIAEFQSFNFHAAGAWQIGALLVTGLAGSVCAAALGQWSRALTLLLFSAMALRSARGLPVLAMAGLPLAAGAWTAALRAWRYSPGWMPRLLDYGNRLEALQRPLRGYAGGAIAAALLGLALAGTPASFPAKEFPVAAAAHLPAGGRLLAPDKFGGYLIYRFDGARKVYFDGRSDFYGAPFLREYIDLVEVRREAAGIVAKYDFTHALLPPRYSLVPFLERAGWKRLYSDETSVLLERNF